MTMHPLYRSVTGTRFIRAAIWAALVIGLSGCAIKQAPSPSDSLASSLPENTRIEDNWSQPSLSEEVDDAWLRSFNDPRLEEIVAEALANNLNMEAAAAQVDAAAALAVQAGSALKPTIGLAAGASSADASGLPTPAESTNAFLNVSWELDVWGRVRAGASAAEASFQATEADYEFARQSLVAQTAKAWFLATQVHAQRELAKEAVDIYTKLVELVETRQEIGKAQPQDLPMARAQRSAAQSNLRAVESSYQEILRSIELILGRYPSAELQAASDFVAVPPSVPAGLPAEILERRPDLIAAERRVAATFFGSQQARAARLPRISLTATGGTIDSGLVDLLGLSDPIANIGADLMAPLYAGGALQAGVEIADAQKRAVIALYTQSVLKAFKEVESALNNELLLAEQERFLKSTVDSSDEAYRITKEQYEVGRLDLLTLLQTQASLLSAKSALISIKNDRLSQRVALHLALGGSFE